MSSDFDRRRFIGAAGIGAAGLVLAADGRPEEAVAQTASTSAKAPMTYEVKPMPFDSSRIEGMSVS